MRGRDFSDYVICMKTSVEFMASRIKQLERELELKSLDVSYLAQPVSVNLGFGLWDRLAKAEQEAAERTTETNEMRHSLEQAQSMLAEQTEEVARLRSELVWVTRYRANREKE